VQFDVVGGLLTFTGLRGGRIRAITLADKAGQTAAAYRLVLFESSPTSISDNATYDIADADLAKIVFQWDIPAGQSAPPVSGAFSGTQSFTDNAYFYSYGLDYHAWSAGGVIYGFLFLPTTSVPTFATTTDLTLSLIVDMQAEK
jgi:hypothetical protein